jgi:hypothetical protein
MNDQVIVEVVGYIVQAGIEMDEYYDWSRKCLRLLDVRLGLKNSVFPPGLVFRDAYGTTAIVRSDRQSLARMPEFLGG